MKKTYKISVSWEMCDEIEIDANSLEEAIIKAEQDYQGLPTDGEYIDGSWIVDEEMSKWLNEEDD